MYGSPKITYQSPKIEKDKSFEKYLDYQITRQKNIDDRATQATKDEDERTRIRNQAGKDAYGSYADNVQNQLNAGLISFNDAQNRLENYRSKYDMPAGDRATALTQNYLENILPFVVLF